MYREWVVGIEKFHPTTKPLELMKWCLKFFPEAQTILDPFGGSCTTLIAAEELGRNCICIEKEQKYVAIGRERLASMTKQLF